MQKQSSHLELISDWLDFKMDLGRAIKMKRLLSGMSHQQLAVKAHIDYEALCAYEAGKKDIPMEHLYRIASALGVNMYSLIPEQFY